MIITINELPRIRHSSGQIGFCSGCFDLTHAGHVLFFEDCKRHCDVLVVMVGCNSAIAQIKPNRPVVPQAARLKMVASLKPVDYAFVDDREVGGNLGFLDDIFTDLQPHFYFINSDTYSIAERQMTCNKHGVTMHMMERTCPPEFESISTSKLLEKL